MSAPDIQIVDTEPKHIREMAEVMHTKTARTALRLGMAPKQALWQSYKRSIICKTAFVNGKIAAIWGISGILMGDKGNPWLVMSPVADEYPFRIAFRYRQELKKMQHMFPILEDFVDEENEQAIRMLELMGFKVGNENIKIGNVNLRRAERIA